MKLTFSTLFPDPQCLEISTVWVCVPYCIKKCPCIQILKRDPDGPYEGKTESKLAAAIDRQGGLPKPYPGNAEKKTPRLVPHAPVAPALLEPAKEASGH